MRPSIFRVITAQRVDARADRRAVVDALLSPWALMAIAVAATFLPPIALAFALVSAAAVHEALPPMPRAVAVAVFGTIPLQYALVAANAWPAAATVVPLVAALGIPLVAVCTGNVASLTDASAQRYFAVMLFVYALSYAPAIGGPALVVLSALALASRLLRNRAQLVPVAVIAVGAPLVFYALRGH